MRFVLILYSILFSYVAADARLLPADSLRLEIREEGSFVIHQVDEEETLYSIARRYKSSVSSIIEYNQIVDNRIEIGQVLEVLIKDAEKASIELPIDSDVTGIHSVEEGETLYSISRKYGIKVRTLKNWNDLEGNAISPGMSLRVSDISIAKPGINEEAESVKVDESTSEGMLKVDSAKSDVSESFEKYLVQTGETLSSIATKIGVQLDSLRLWNELRSDYLKIGQSLLFRSDAAEKELSLVKPTEQKTVRIDEDGFERIYEEGTTSVIESMKTTRYLALHRTLPIGTDLEVRSLMNNRIVHVKVVGRLPDTGLNKNLLLRLSRSAYDQLGILDSKSKVEVSYYKK